MNIDVVGQTMAELTAGRACRVFFAATHEMGDTVPMHRFAIPDIFQRLRARVANY